MTILQGLISGSGPGGHILAVVESLSHKISLSSQPRSISLESNLIGHVYGCHLYFFTPPLPPQWVTSGESTIARRLRHEFEPSMAV